MILVAGATGYLGREICRRLIDQGEPVHGLVRATSDRTATRELESMGVDLVLGDLRDRASLGRFVAHLAETGVHAGMSDHAVSEADCSRSVK